MIINQGLSFQADTDCAGGFLDVGSDDKDPWSGVGLIWSGFLNKLPGLLAHELSIYNLNIRNDGPMGRTLCTATLAIFLRIIEISIKQPTFKSKSSWSSWFHSRVVCALAK